ncbi:Uncharacterised protein [Mycobacterium tuberculosis]|nr:Uncharacterised protein [Mycobacterium tuberculosis]
MHIRHVQHTGLVEGPHHPGGLDGKIDVGELHDCSLPRSSRSESATTNAVGGFQVNTPAGCPAVTCSG